MARLGPGAPSGGRMTYIERHSIVAETRRGFAADTAGPTTIEYSLVGSGIALASISAVSLLGEAFSSVFMTLWLTFCSLICVVG